MVRRYARVPDTTPGTRQGLRERVYRVLTETESVPAAILDVTLAGHSLRTARAIVYWVVDHCFSGPIVN